MFFVQAPFQACSTFDKIELQCHQTKEKLSFFKERIQTVVLRVRVEDLPVLDQHLLPDDLPDDFPADATQLGERGVAVGIVEAVQQNLGDLSLLLSYHPGKDVFQKYVNLSIGIFLKKSLFSLPSPLFGLGDNGHCISSGKLIMICKDDSDNNNNNNSPTSLMILKIQREKHTLPYLPDSAPRCRWYPGQPAGQCRG